MSIQNQRLYKLYREKVQNQLSSYLKVKNFHAVPRLEKIVINRGLGKLAQNPKALTQSLNELATITGQYGIITKAKKPIATFKIRKSMQIGVSVTLRGKKMYAFLDRLINLALPRIRDFQGISHKKFDGNGNYNLGLNEQLMFPEIDFDKIDQIQGMDIAIVTTAKTDESAWFLLSSLGMPFSKKFELSNN